MSGRLVVGLDGSAHSTAAARWAVSQARLHGAEVEVVTAYDSFGPGVLPDRDLLHDEAQVLSACLRMQQEQLAEIEHDDVKVFPTVVRGHASRSLAEASEGAQGLVIGAQGHGGASALMLGSVSLRCIQHAPCPVTIVPAYAAEVSPDAPVVAAVQDVESGPLSLLVAIEEARVRGTGVVALHAVHWQRLGTELIHPSEEQLVGWGEQLLEAAIAATPGADGEVPVERRVVAGHPAEVIEATGKEAALLVIGSRGHGRLAGVLLGSVSLHVVARAVRPTTVVRAS